MIFAFVHIFTLSNPVPDVSPRLMSDYGGEKQGTRGSETGQFLIRLDSGGGKLDNRVKRVPFVRPIEEDEDEDGQTGGMTNGGRLIPKCLVCLEK